MAKIKISSVQNLAEARFAASLGCDYIGFNGRTGSSLARYQLPDVMQWVSGPTPILEVSAPTMDELTVLSELLNISNFELSLSDYLSMNGSNDNFNLWLRVNLNEIQALSQIKTDLICGITLQSNEIENVLESLPKLPSLHDTDVFIDFQGDENALKNVLGADSVGINFSTEMGQNGGLNFYDLMEFIG